MFLIRINFFLLFLNQDTSCIFYNMRSVAKVAFMSIDTIPKH